MQRTDSLGRFVKGFTPWNKGKKCPLTTGANNFKWKGGRKILTQGYILILKPDHPFHDKQGYVREHRLVMEKYLGRILNPKEVVHHKNGIHSDNRIENLELFEDNGKHLITSRTIMFKSETQKQCSHCLIIKDRREFSPQKSNTKQIDPHQSWCKKCHTEYQRQHRTLNHNHQ